jgi:ATP/maltotriose-dependent transcriptional regulator MalT
MTADAIVGRAAELEAVDRLVGRLADGPAALVLEGLPGIGKTTVWRRVFACSDGAIVLSCRPVEAEAKLAFASLADLLEPVAQAAIARLPEPQRIALDVALMRASPPGAPPSARAVATAVLSTLRLLTDETPVVLAIDDLQWLDRASAEALAFALRRIGDRRVGVVATVRLVDGRAADPLALDAAFAGAVERRRLGPLGLAELHHVVQARLDHVFPRPVLRRIADASGGNPFFAVELGRALLEAGVRPGASEPFPIPDTLASLVVRRLDRLPARTRETLLAAAALSAPTVDLLRAAIGEPDADAAISRAQGARLLDVDDGHVRFAHPLFAAAVYSSATGEARRDVHRRLARVVDATEERARHLALAASHPSDEVAVVLDDAAVLARRRGAPDLAGDLQEQAARLTPPDDAAGSRWRRIVAAQHFFHAGARGHAHELLDGVLAEEVVGPQRAVALRLLGQLRSQEDSFREAIDRFTEALVHSDDEAAKAAIRLELGFATFMIGDLPRALGAARDALAAAERLDAPGLLADALGLVTSGEFLAGLGCNVARLERALALEDRSRAGLLLLRPSSVAGLIAMWEGRLAEAGVRLRAICESAAVHGEESGLPFILLTLSWLEWWRGDLAASTQSTEESLLIAVQTASETLQALSLAHRARTRATAGDVAGARADLAEARALMGRTDDVNGLQWVMTIEGMLELSLGDAAAAERSLAPLAAVFEGLGIGEPWVAYFVPDAAEALTRTGQTERASALLARFDERARALGRQWAIANAARARAVLAAEQGDLDAALAAAEDAVERSERLGMPVDAGRALLVLGAVRRRRGERRVAREALERAVAVLRGVGARPWTQRAEEELARIPVRRGAGDELTPTEARVAALAGAGHTNQEVAKALFMSPKTVEANLTRIYGKLGIRSRAELGARMLERQRAEK